MSQEVLLKPTILPESPEKVRLLDDQTSQFSQDRSKAWTQRSSYADPTWVIERHYRGLRIDEAADVMAALQSAQGRFALVWASPSWKQRGNFPSSEVLSNNNFSSGTTSWSASNGTLTVNDSVARITASGAATNVQLTRTGLTVTQYSPYVYRAMFNPGSRMKDLRVYLSSALAAIGSGAQLAPGMRKMWQVVNGTTATFIAYNNDALALSFGGSYFEVPWVSLSRCALVDNSPNAVLQSDTFDNATWTKTNSSITANATTAPDGNSTADSLVEDATATVQHRVSQTGIVAIAAAGDVVFTVCLKAGTRTWAYIQANEVTGVTVIAQYLNLSTGALGSSSAGANWSNFRSFVTDLGDGWYQYTMAARKTNTAATVGLFIGAATGDAGAVYTGDGVSNIYMWRAGVHAPTNSITQYYSGVPFWPGVTTTVSSSGTLQAGGGLWLKGLPVSNTTGLLLAGDFIEVNNELKQVTAPLVSNASGLGFLTFRPALYASPNDGEAVVVNNPMGVFALDTNARWDSTFGSYVDIDIRLREINDG